MTMTIGQLVKELEKADIDSAVYIDFGGCIPTEIDSWRGVYTEAALGWMENSYGVETPRVGDLIRELKSSIGKIYIGYKGGENTFNGDTSLHIDNDGKCTHTEIRRVEIKRHQVIIHTYLNED